MEKGGRNLYCLVGNAPLSRIDPFGLADGWFRCGVKTLEIVSGITMHGTTGFNFPFTVRAEYSNMNTRGFYSSCCAYVQYVMTSSATVDGQVPNNTGNPPIDGYFHVDKPD